MIEISNVETFGWESAFRGMRNPMNSWDKNDTTFINGTVDIGTNDLDLAQRLIKSGTDHRKFLRMITVTLDIKAPLYWWKEFDTYKVGTVANSCSTMHKIHDKEFTLDDFSCDELAFTVKGKDGMGDTYSFTPMSWINTTINQLNSLRKLFRNTGEKKYWYAMIQLLPSCYMQKRTVQLNYEVLRNMYHSRHNHKLKEWRELCNFIFYNLPYSQELIVLEGGVDNE